MGSRTLSPDDINTCKNCGVKAHLDGEGYPRAAVAFTPNELAELAVDTGNPEIRRRLLCALSILDPEVAEALRNGMTLS